MTDMLLWCVDNLDIMEVSYEAVYIDQILIITHDMTLLHSILC